KRLAIDFFHGDEVDRRTVTLAGADFVNRDQMRVIERRSGLGFLHETAQASGIGSHQWWKNLQSNMAAKCGIDRFVYRPHASRSEYGEDVVSPDLLRSEEHTSELQSR